MVGLGTVVLIVTAPLDGTPPVQLAGLVQSVLVAPVQVCAAAGEDITIARVTADTPPRRREDRLWAAVDPLTCAQMHSRIVFQLLLLLACYFSDC
jgi:hypothetical protein